MKKNQSQKKEAYQKDMAGKAKAQEAAEQVAKEPKDGEKTKSVAFKPDFGMVVNALKNFGKNLIYVFVPMGTVYLFMLFAILLFTSSTVKNLSEALNQIIATVGESIEQSSASVEEFLAYAFGRIDWNGNFFDTISKILSTNWISETLKGFFDTLSASTEGFDARIATIASNFTGALKADIGIAAAIIAVGIWLANTVTRYVLRRRTAKRSVRGTIAAHTLVPIAQSAAVFAASVLFAFIKWFAILALVAAVALWAIISLLNSFIIYRDKDTPLDIKDVITLRNVISHIFVGLLVLAIDVVLFVALWFTNPILCVLIMIPFLIYSLNIIDSNTDSYVQRLVVAIKNEQVKNAD